MTEATSILLVEDEEHLAVGIQYNLQQEGYRVTVAGDGPTALEVFELEPDRYDLVVLDLMLPRMSGYAVCESIRRSSPDIPILILSARTLSEDRTRGFDVGANQYLTKPFDLDELLSRVKNLLQHTRRQGSPPVVAESDRYTFGDVEVDFEAFVVTVRGEPVKLTPLELKLLRYFVDNENRVIPRSELLENVWETSGQLTTRAVDQFVMRLRKSLEADPSQPRHFLTLRDAGYRFVANP